MRRSIAALFSVAAVMAATAAGYAALGGARQAALPRAKIQPSPVRVTGNTSDLFPGIATPLPLEVRNLTNGPVRLQWVRAIVDQPNGNCDPGYLHAQQIWPRQRIPARGLIALEMPLTLAPEAPDGCQGVTFPLRYRTRVNVLGARR
jgi:hypothetical protein